MALSKAGSEPVIGGVFPLAERPSHVATESVLSNWGADATAVSLFHNARSAVRHAVVDRRLRRFWLPAYVCPELVAALKGVEAEIRYYPVAKRLEPDTDFLAGRLQPGDGVLGIDYFGRPSAHAWRDLVAAADAVLWVEDCAQALDTGGQRFGAVRVYSPRKLLGVPDGGVLVDVRGTLSSPMLEPAGNDGFVLPYRLRAADPEGRDRERWYRAFQAAESAMAFGNLAMSTLSEAILRGTAIEPISVRRRENYLSLLSALREWALFPEPPQCWAPLGFPLLTASAEGLGDYLAERHVFAPRHWRGLPSPAAEFPKEHRLSRSLLTLPCDQRYGPAEMERVAALVKRFGP